MAMALSPYALLRASKPKPPQTVTTSYDLYSLSLPAAVSPDVPTPQTDAVNPTTPEQSTASPPPRRTHYIADIHARHTSALRHTPQDTRPL